MSNRPEPMSTFMIVLANIYQQEGAYKRSSFNKVIKSLGYEPMSKDDFDYTIVEQIKDDPELINIYNRALDNELTLKDTVKETGYAPTDGELSFDNVLSTWQTDKQRQSIQMSQLRKFKKEISGAQIATQAVSDGILDAISKSTFTQVKPSKKKQLREDKTMVVVLSDWHIGATVKASEMEGNSYNFEIAKDRISKFIDETLKQIEYEKPERVILLHGGDLVEGIDMRTVNQAYDAEFDATTQVSKATRLMIEVINSIQPYVKSLEVGIVGGNHDRFSSDKKSAVYNDNLAYNIIDSLLLLQDANAFQDNVKILDNRNNVYTLEFSIFGKTLLLIHGDTLPSTSKPKIPLLLKDHPIDYVVFGHYHYSMSVQENKYRTSYMVGSLQGFNSYSRQLNLPDTQASQLILVFENGSDTVKNIPVML
ncbi:metallophosphoesterase [Streptomyces sp. TRM76323]|uniref:Metallophosphoesterase n=1 Tax=Streptomyces tamarix TaxID=3078565 RepID=A0ABU3QKY1_9ACTN|nr:metallophosphoesterase [Streptomyces tamarix]MDT9683423.1 metallophosphoesterase [Streptomyces tamarix]